jgi:asparagine synthase (glutamine-hydrolysing)
LVCWAAAAAGANIRTFTVTIPGDDGDESADAVATARQLGIPNSLIQLSTADPPATADLVSAYGEPFACPSALGMLRISRAVKQEVTVLLTGDGGDDIFLGYPYHRHFLIAQQAAKLVPPAFARMWPGLRRAVPVHGLFRRLQHFVDYSAGGLGAVINAHNGFVEYQKFGLLGGRIEGVSPPQRQTLWSLESAQHLLEEFLVYDWQTTLTGEYLTKVDGATMYYALEARSPFLDHVLWEYAGALPFQIRLQHGRLKAVLREIARKRLGADVASRAKRGFEIPVCKWLSQKWGPRFLELFNDSLLATESFIRKEPVLELWRQTAPTGRVPMQLWRLFVLENWIRAEAS